MRKLKAYHFYHAFSLAVTLFLFGCDAKISPPSRIPSSSLPADTSSTFESLAIYSITPNSGSASGGTPVLIKGKGFSGVSVLKLGGLPCLNLNIVSDTQLNCTTPPSTPGVADITVGITDSPAGSSKAATRLNAFTFTQGAPVLSGVSPRAGPLLGGGTLTLTGSGFVSGAAVSVGGVVCDSVSVISGTQSTCVLRSGSAGVKDIIFTNSDGQASTLLAAYTYQEGPSLDTVTPSAGGLGGGTLVTLLGSNFRDGVSVQIGGTLISDVIRDSPTQIRFRTPSSSAAGTKTIVVTNTDGQAATKWQSFNYLETPTLTSIAPTSGPPTGNTLIVLNGTQFSSPMAVTVGGNPCTYPSVVSPIKMTCLTPSGSAGLASVAIQNSAGLGDVLPLAFTYQSSISVSSVEPPAGPLSGGNTLLINGAGFQTGAIIKIGEDDCLNPTYQSPSLLTCKAPTKLAGTYAVTVKNPDSQTATLQNAYRYQTPPIVLNVSSITPNGSYNEGKTVSIQVTFTEPVKVTGFPYLTLETGASKAQALYSQGSETSTLSFNYIVGPNENTSDLDAVGVNGLSLNGGTIVDSNSTPVILTLPAPGSTNSLGNNKNIIIDTVAPTAPSISINAGAQYTNSNLVDLTLSASGADFMYVTNNSNCTSGGRYEVYAAQKAAWILSNTNTTTAVYVKFKDAAGNESACVGDTIIHDDIKPQIPNLDIATKTFNSSFTVTASESSHDDNFKEFRYKKDGTIPTCADGIATSGPIPVTENQSVILKVVACDFAGKRSLLPATGAYTYDGAKPTITFSSIAPASPSGETKPVLNFILSKSSSVNLYSDLNCQEANKLSSATSLGSGAQSLQINPALSSDGTYPIYAQGTDSVGNTSDCTLLTTYVLDRNKPQFTNLSLSPNSPSSNRTPTAYFTLNKSASVTLYQETCQAANAISSTQTKSGNANLALNSLATDLVYKIYIEGVDSAGNKSDCTKVGDYQLDTAAPQLSNLTLSPTSPSASVNPVVNFNVNESSNVKLYSNDQCTIGLSDTVLKDASTLQSLPLYTLTSDGTYSVFIKATDLAGNATTCISVGDYLLDRALPSITQVSFTPGSPSNNLTPTVNFTLSKKATTTFYKDTCDSLNAITASSLKESGPQSLLVSFPGEGTFSVVAKAIDLAGNTTSCVTIGSYTVDTQAPLSPSIQVNSGASYTKSNLVDLTLSAIGADFMYVTNDSTCASGGVYEAFNSLKTAWAISNAQKNTTAAVYVKYKDQAGNESACVGDTIIHDDISPQTPNLDIASKSFNSSFTVTASQGSPSDTNFKEFRYTKTGVSPVSCTDGTATSGAISISEITNVTLKVISCDYAGNFSSAATGTYSFNNLRPAVQLTATNTNPTNSNLSVTATFSADVTLFDATKINLTNGNIQNFQSTSAKIYTVTVLPQGDGLVTVQVPENSAKDSADNLNTASNELSITFDGTAPSLSNLSFSPTSPSSNANPTVSFLLSEAVKEVRLYKTAICDINQTYTLPTAKALGNQSLSLSLAVDGTYPVYVKAIDNAGNGSDCLFVGSYQLDTALPSMSLFSFSPSSPSNSQTPLASFTLNKEATVTFYKESCDTLNALSASLLKSSGAQTLLVSFPGEGIYPVFAKAIDAAKNTSGCVSVGSYTVDLTPPQSPSIKINNDDAYTKNALVDLTLSALGASSMYITNDSSCNSGGVYEAYNTSKTAWAILNAQKNSAATVYVKFKDLAGNESPCVSDSIIHDDISPQTPLLDIASKNFSGSFTVTASQNPTPDTHFKEFRYTKTGVSPTSCSDGTATSGSISITETASLILKVIACDSAGNFSSAATGTYVFNNTKPTVQLTTTNPNPTKSNIQVTATFSTDVTNFDSTKITLTNGSIQNFQSTSAKSYTFTIIPTADGVVTAQVPAGSAKDDADNLNLASNLLSVTYDGTAPDLTALSFTPVSPNSNPAPSVNFTLVENNQATVTLFSTSSCNTTPISQTSAPFTQGQRSLALNTLLTQGSYPVFAKATDLAGNESACKSVGTYVFDSTKPVISAPFSFSPGAISNSATPTASFTLSKSASVMLYRRTCDSSNSLSAATAFNFSGSAQAQQIQLNTLATEDTYVVVGQATDLAGNVGDCTSIGSYKYDKTKPILSSFSFNPLSPSFDTAPKVNMTANEDSSVTLYSSSNCQTVPSTAISTAKAFLKDTASFAQVTGFSTDGTYPIYAQATDAAGNLSDCTLSGSYVLDRALPVITADATTPISPTSPSSNATPTAKFSVSKGSTVILYNGSACSSAISSSVTVAANTSATLQISPALTSGTYQIYAKATDISGNTSLCTPIATDYVIDFAQPAITSLSQSAGPLGGGNSVVINGSNFKTGAVVTFGSNTASCSLGTLTSGVASQITCTVPQAASLGAVTVTVTNPNQLFATTTYTYQAGPTLSNINPSAGPLAGGTTVTLTGTNFRTGLSITVGGTACTTSNYVSSTSATCVTPAKTAGTYDVVLTNSDTQSATLASAYTYQAAPTLTSVSLNTGPTTGGTTITLTGTNFRNGLSISIGGTLCTTSTYGSSTSATCVTPAKTAGTYAVILTNSDNQVTSQSVSYTYTYQLAFSTSCTDTYLSRVALRLPMEGSNGSTTFADVSPNSSTITASGTAKISTGKYKIGTASGVFDGTTNTFVTAPKNSAFSPGTGDFVIEMFVNFSSIPTVWTGLAQLEGKFGSGSLSQWYLSYYAPEGLMLGQNWNSGGLSATVRSSAAWTPSVNVWYHIAAVRSSGAVKIYINGISQTVTNPNALSGISFLDNGILLGYENSTNYFNGYIDEFRYTVGSDRGYNGTTLPTLCFNALAPSVPTSVTGVRGDQQVTLSWSLPSDGMSPITDYLIQSSTDNGVSWTDVNDGVSTATSATITGLSNSSTYKFRVAAVNAIGTSAYSTDYLNVDTSCTDSYAAKVALRLPMEGSNGSTTFTDVSPNSSTITASGTAKISTGKYKIGTASGVFDGGASTYVRSPTNSAYSVGTGDFAVEMFVNFSSIPTGSVGFAQSQASTGSAVTDKWWIGYNYSSNGALTFGQHSNTAAFATTPWSPSTNVWYHIAVVRASGIIKMYIDGLSKSVANASSFSSVSFANAGFLVGTVSTLGVLNGYIDEFRYTVGSDRGYNGTQISNVCLNQFHTAPTTLTASAASNQINLNWTAPTDNFILTDYVIQYSADNGVTWTTFADGVSIATTAIITGLVPGTNYLFRVGAKNNSDIGAYSSSSNSVTLIGTCTTLCGGTGDGCYDSTTALSNVCATLRDGYENSATPTIIELKNANSTCTGGSCFKVWWQQGTNRILNASGLWTNGGVGAWQQALNRNGIGTNGDFNSSTQIAALEGRVCPGKTTGSGTFIDFTNMVDSTRCLYYDSGNTMQALDAAGTRGTEASDWLQNWNRAATGRGTSSSYYEGNVKTCADKGMRLPVMYETTMTKPTSWLPTGDTGVTPTWAGSTNGVPRYLGYTWTASAYTINTDYYWIWSGTSSISSNIYYNSFYVRCVLP